MKKIYAILIISSFLLAGNKSFAQTSKNVDNPSIQQQKEPKSFVKKQHSTTKTNSSAFGPATNKKNATAPNQAAPKNLAGKQSKTNESKSSLKPASSIAKADKGFKTKEQIKKENSK